MSLDQTLKNGVDALLAGDVRTKDGKQLEARRLALAEKDGPVSDNTARAFLNAYPATETAQAGELEELRIYPQSPIWLIAAERVRQQNQEGWTPEHDDKHEGGELARAAAAYAAPSWLRALLTRAICSESTRSILERLWPWEQQWWKPTPDNRQRELVKACALLVAEYERLSRAAIRAARSAERKEGT